MGCAFPWQPNMQLPQTKKTSDLDLCGIHIWCMNQDDFVVEMGKEEFGQNLHTLNIVLIKYVGNLE